MAEATGIQWCDATLNPWVGCEKVSPGCAHCYAEKLVTGRMSRPGTWGADGVRERTSESNWKKPLRWARLARDGRLPNGDPNPDGHRPRIFCASLADVFEERDELDDWRDDLLSLIYETPELDWLLLTKRPEVARDRRPWGDQPPPNVWLGVSIENARHTWRADVLREIPAAVRFISAEPLLGSLFPKSGVAPDGSGDHGDDRAAAKISEHRTPNGTQGTHRAPLDLSGIDWVIVGGESGPGARPFHLEHAREIIRGAVPDCDCYIPWLEGAGQHSPGCAVFKQTTAVFMKQLGARPIVRTVGHAPDGTAIPFDAVPLELRDRKGGDWSEWPADLRIREFPRPSA